MQMQPWNEAVVRSCDQVQADLARGSILEWAGDTEDLGSTDWNTGERGNGYQPYLGHC